jgi:hypothetical protein
MKNNPNQREVVERILKTIILQNKEIFDKLPEENLSSKEVLNSLISAIDKNGRQEYLLQLLKQSI